MAKKQEDPIQSFNRLVADLDSALTPPPTKVKFAGQRRHPLSHLFLERAKALQGDIDTLLGKNESNPDSLFPLFQRVVEFLDNKQYSPLAKPVFEAFKNSLEQKPKLAERFIIIAIKFSDGSESVYSGKNNPSFIDKGPLSLASKLLENCVGLNLDSIRNSLQRAIPRALTYLDSDCRDNKREILKQMTSRIGKLKADRQAEQERLNQRAEAINHLNSRGRFSTTRHSRTSPVIPLRREFAGIRS